VRLRDTSSLSYEFMMGIDKDVEITNEDLRKMFYSNSYRCDIHSFKIVTKSDGTDYPLSNRDQNRF
jgi:hypothetical protein